MIENIGIGSQRIGTSPYPSIYDFNDGVELVFFFDFYNAEHASAFKVRAMYYVAKNYNVCVDWACSIFLIWLCVVFGLCGGLIGDVCLCLCFSTKQFLF